MLDHQSLRKIRCGDMNVCAILDETKNHIFYSIFSTHQHVFDLSVLSCLVATLSREPKRQRDSTMPRITFLRHLFLEISPPCPSCRTSSRILHCQPKAGLSSRCRRGSRRPKKPVCQGEHPSLPFFFVPSRVSRLDGHRAEPHSSRQGAPSTPRTRRSSASACSTIVHLPEVNVRPAQHVQRAVHVDYERPVQLAETTEPAARRRPTCASERPRPPYLAMRNSGNASSIRTTQNEKKA